MRVLLTTWGSRGDVVPVVGLAVRLKELGAEAEVGAPPDEEFAALLDRVGVPLVPVGPTVKSVVTRERTPTTEDAFRLAADLVAARFDTLAKAAERCDAVLATGLMPAGVRSVAEYLGIRYVRASFHTLGLPSRYLPPSARPGKQSSADETDNTVLWEQDAQRVHELYGKAENEHRAKLGMAPLDNVRDYAFSDQPWLAADPILWPWQALISLDLVQTGPWILPDDRPLPDDVETFLAAGEPPVYVGFGSIKLHGGPELVQDLVGAVRAQGRRVLLGSGWASLDLADDRDDCLVVDETNHQALFGRVAAVVHHGGAGTTTTAAAAGVPQVVVPQLADQPFWAARVAELGIGVAHDGPVPTLDSLSAALAAVLTPQRRARAEAVAGAIRTDGTTVAANLLLDETGRAAEALKTGVRPLKV